MQYKVIFVNWTKPYFYRNEAEGYNKLKLSSLSSTEYDMIDYELLINRVSIENARKYTNAPIKLYTDDAGYSFYKKHDMIGMFDEIDIQTLNEYNKKNINAGKWWTSGKSIVFGKEPTPFLFLDNDFIIEEKIPETKLFEYDLVHTHWEIQRERFYVTNQMIDNLEVPISNFVERMMMPNTSFVFMNNAELQEKYFNDHLHIISKQYDYIPEWLWLLSDQGILGYNSRELNCEVGTIEDKIYLSFAEELLTEKENLRDKCGFSPKWIYIDDKRSKLFFKYYHVWFDKHTMKVNHDFRKKIIKYLNNQVDEKPQKNLLY